MKMSMEAYVSLRRRGSSLIWSSRYNPRRSVRSLQRSCSQPCRYASVLAQNLGNFKHGTQHAGQVSKRGNMGPTPRQDRSVKIINPSRREPEVTRAMASWLSYDGKGIDHDKIFRQLPVRTTASHVNTAIFFVTPKFAHLLEPESNFLDAAMNRMLPVTFDREKQPMKSVVAVVDAIPSVEKGFGPHKYVRSTEGIALCLTPTPHLVLDSQNGQADPPMIAFTTAFKYAKGGLLEKLQGDNLNAEARPGVAFSYSGLPANTLFINGRKHTLTLQHWDRVNASLLCRPKVDYLSYLEIPIYEHDNRSYVNVQMESNLQVLTEPAKIISSMGNILREISNKQGEITSSSHELEIVVPPLVKTKQEYSPEAEIRVFALIYPDSERARNIKISDEKMGRAKSFKLHQLLLLEGARLHRVTSGGAGWGKKAGLLSLDPITQLNQPAIEESAASFFPGFEFEEGDMGEDSTVREKLLPEGHLVQFLAAFRTPGVSSFADQASSKEPMSDDAKLPPNDHDHDPPWKQTNYFTPSKFQRLTIGTTTNESTPQDDGETSNTTYFHPNSFGFLTVSPIGINVITPQEGSSNAETSTTSKDNLIPSARIVHSTLVEVPNASFLSASPAGGKRVDVPDKDVEMLHPEVAEMITQMATSANRVTKAGIKRLATPVEEVKNDESQPAEVPGFRTRYIERFFQTVTGESRPGDIQRFNRAIQTSGMIRKLRARSDKESLLKRIIALTMGRRRNKKREKDLAELAGLTEIGEEGDPEGPVISKVRKIGSVRKVDQYDNRTKAEYSNYRDQDKEEFREGMRQRADEMAPSREKRYRTTKSVESEANTGLFDRQRKQQKDEKAVVGSLLNDISEEEKNSGSNERKS